VIGGGVKKTGLTLTNMLFLFYDITKYVNRVAQKKTVAQKT